MATNEYYTKQRLKDRKEVDAITKELKQRTHELKEAQDIIAVLTQENLEIGKINKDLMLRYDKECINITKDINGMVTDITYLPAYRTYLPYQEIEGYSMSDIYGIIQTPLYAKFPFIYEEDRQLRIDESQLTKYKLGGAF